LTRACVSTAGNVAKTLPSLNVIDFSVPSMSIPLGVLQQLLGHRFQVGSQLPQFIAQQIQRASEVIVIGLQRGHLSGVWAFDFVCVLSHSVIAQPHDDFPNGHESGNQSCRRRPVHGYSSR
jgi:hypothetical protein